MKRDQSSSCTYIHSSIRDKTAHIQKASLVSGSQDVHGRIRHLEELLVSLMQNANTSNQYSAGKDSHIETAAYPDISDGGSYSTNDLTGVNGTSDSLGRMSIDDKHAYVGGPHWAAILESVRSSYFIHESLRDAVLIIILIDCRPKRERRSSRMVSRRYTAAFTIQQQRSRITRRSTPQSH
jgi:hypothetical protein